MDIQEAAANMREIVSNLDYTIKAMSEWLDKTGEHMSKDDLLFWEEIFSGCYLAAKQFKADKNIDTLMSS